MNVDSVVSSIDLGDIQATLLEQAQIYLQTQMTNNDFLVAGVFTVLLSSILYTLRRVPGTIWAFLKHRFTVRVSVFNNNPNFIDFAKQLNKNTIQLFSRHKMLDGDNLTIGMGHSVSWFKGRLVYVTREKEESDSREFKQTITVTFPFLTYNKLSKLFAEFIEEKKREKIDNISIYNLSDRGYLDYHKDSPKRPRETVFLPEDQIQYIEDRINFFQKNKDWYRKRGIPYKYAILLHGVPGTGKTTLAKYLASYTGRNLVLATPSRISKMASAISGTRNFDAEWDDWGNKMPGEDDGQRNRWMGLMEDIDCDNVTAKRKSTINTNDEDENDEDDSPSNSIKNAFVNLSDLLNSIDGMNAPEDFILIATTNHINDLDPALLRKGRFDDVIEIKALDTPEIKKMICVFREIPFEDLDGMEFDPIPGSVLQDLILQYIDRPLDEFLNALENRNEYTN